MSLKKSVIAIALFSAIFFTNVGCGNTEINIESQTDATQLEAKPETESEVDANNRPVSDFESETPYKLTDSMQVTISENQLVIIQKDVVNGIPYSLTLNLEKAAGYTSEEQLVICTRLFWYCYPKMYERMGVDNTPTDVNLLVENEDYEIACQWDNNVHIHDQWLYNNPTDFDCLTHEFAHVIQTDWSGDYSPNNDEGAYLTERFADTCRYLYAYENGRYNNDVWTLCTVDEETAYAESNRFWVWIDRTYSNENADILKRLVAEAQIHDDAHAFDKWSNDGPMWDVIFAETDAYGKSLDELWDIFVQSDFAWEK